MILPLSCMMLSLYKQEVPLLHPRPHHVCIRALHPGLALSGAVRVATCT